MSKGIILMRLGTAFIPAGDEGSVFCATVGIDGAEALEAPFAHVLRVGIDDDDIDALGSERFDLGGYRGGEVGICRVHSIRAGVAEGGKVFFAGEYESRFGGWHGHVLSSVSGITTMAGGGAVSSASPSVQDLSRA